MDEGWTRLLLEQFGFPYQTLKDAEIKAGNLGQRIDVLILPDDSIDMVTGDNAEGRLRENAVPPEYRSGIGEEGVEAIKEFVEGGGTLVTLNQTCDFAIEKLDLPVQNILAGKSAKEFYCPGSTLHANIDTNHQLTYGMPDEGLIFFWSGPTFRVQPSFSNERCEILVQYPEREILQSGWLVGEEHIAGTAWHDFSTIRRRLGCPVRVQATASGANARNVQVVFQCTCWLGMVGIGRIVAHVK